MIKVGDIINWDDKSHVMLNNGCVITIKAGQYKVCKVSKMCGWISLKFYNVYFRYGNKTCRFIVIIEGAAPVTWNKTLPIVYNKSVECCIVSASKLAYTVQKDTSGKRVRIDKDMMAGIIGYSLTYLYHNDIAPTKPWSKISLNPDISYVQCAVKGKIHNFYIVISYSGIMQDHGKCAIEVKDKNGNMMLSLHMIYGLVTLIKNNITTDFIKESFRAADRHMALTRKAND